MTLYFGLPVRIHEAARILGVTGFDVNVGSDYYARRDAIESVQRHLRRHPVAIGAHYTDKGQVILGYIVLSGNTAGDFASFLTAGEMIDKVLALQTRFNEDMARLGASLRKVDIYPIEDEISMMEYATPYFITWNE